jgi:hypothetical protein
MESSDFAQHRQNPSIPFAMRKMAQIPPLIHALAKPMQTEVTSLLPEKHLTLQGNQQSVRLKVEMISGFQVIGAREWRLMA